MYFCLKNCGRVYFFFDNFQDCEEDDENGENDDFFSRPDDDDGAMFGSLLHPRRLRKALGLVAVSNCGDHKEQRPFFQYFHIEFKGRKGNI